jgi:nicotinate-nucleotide pyrophosphorylase (carboxylating)
MTSKKTAVHEPAPALAFGAAEREEAAWLIARALAEDLPAGDLTTQALFGVGGIAGKGAFLEAAFVSRSEGVLCGLSVVHELFARSGPGGASLTDRACDGDRLEPGMPFLTVRGPAVDVLPLERIALNFLQRLSGIATLTRRFADEVAGTGATLLDTRKTAPGWRSLEKYAVRAGGGANHRKSLSEAFLLKDNHAAELKALGRGGIPEWIAAMRRTAPDRFLEVEVDGREEFRAALDAGADSILLDNFSTPEIRWAVEQRNARGRGKPLLEASGGMRLERVREVALAGVERISVGALTHSAGALDIGLDWIRAYREGDS